MNRGLAFLLIFLFTYLAQAATPSVVFIHGRGPASLDNPVNALNYWDDLIAAATNNYSLPVEAIHYDATQHMKDISPKVVNQLIDFINVHQVPNNQLVVIAHSYGGVVMRYILSNASQSAAFTKVTQTIRHVVTLSSPHLGSEAADLGVRMNGSDSWIERSLAEWFESVNASMQLLTTSNMAYINENCILLGSPSCPPLPKPFYLVSGGHNADFWATYWEIDDDENFQIALLSPFVGFPGIHDGVVAQYSSEGITSNAKLVYQSVRNHHHLRNNRYNPQNDPETMASFLSKYIHH